MSAVDMKLSFSEEMIQRRKRIAILLGELRELIDEILDAEADCGGSSPPTPCDSVSDRVADLREHLAKMFEMEETSGWMTDSLSLAPHLANESVKLLIEHTTLLTQLDELYEMSGSCVCPSASWSDIERKFREFRHTFSAHESREDEIAQRVFFDDIGPIN